MRIACQLVEAETGRQLWSERFAAALDDIFELQDRVKEAMAGALEPSLRAAEIRCSLAKPTDSLAAYDLYPRALPLVAAQQQRLGERVLEVAVRRLD